MRKFTVITLSCVIVLLSFAFCFADGGSPVIVPVSEDGLTGVSIELSNNTTHLYSSNNSPVYIVWYTNGSQNRILCFSEFENTVVYNNSNGSISSMNLNNSYNGYYYSNGVSATPTNESYIMGDFSSPQDAIDYVNESVFSTTFNLTYLVDGSVSWLSSMAQAVKTNGLLLFFVLFIFVGVGIGLFKRFTN